MPATLTIVGNTNDALAAIAKLERQFDSLQNKIKQTKAAGDAGDGGFGKMSAGATRFAQQLTGVASGIDLIFKGIQAANSEWQDFVERQGKALDANQTFAKSLETLAFNTAGDAKFNSLAKVEALVNQMSKETGVGVNDVARALSNAASAKGQLSLEEASDAVRAVLNFMPNSTGTQDVLAGSVLDIRKHVQGASPEDAIGFTAMLGQQARITDPTKVAENAVPAAILMSKIDKGNLQDNAAIYAAITQATGDVQGRTSRTGGIALALQLEQALPEMKDTLSRVRFMQENPDAAKAFMEGGEHGGRSFKGMDMQLTGPNGEDITFGTDKASFEKKVLPAIRELLRKDSATTAVLESALTMIPDVEKGDAVYAKQLADLRNSPAMQVVAEDRALKATEERNRIADSKGAKGASVRQGFEGVMSSQGVGWLGRQEAGWSKFGREWILQQSPDEAAINTAGAMANSLERNGGFEQARKYRKVEEDLRDALPQDPKRLADLDRKGQGLLRQIEQNSGNTEVVNQLRQQTELIQQQITQEKKRPINPNGNREGQ